MRRVCCAREPLETFPVGNQYRGFGVRNREGKFGTIPEHVERRRDRTGHDRCEEHDGPLGKVAHCDGDAIALADAEFLHQCDRESVSLVAVRFVRQPLVAQHEKVSCCGQLTTTLNDVTDDARRVLPHPSGTTADLDGLDLEQTARPG